MEIMQLAGLTAAGFAMTFVMKKYSKGKLLVGGNLALAASIIVLALTRNLFVATLLNFIAGWFNLLSNSISRTMLK